MALFINSLIARDSASAEHTLNLGSGIGAAFAERSDKQKL